MAVTAAAVEKVGVKRIFGIGEVWVQCVAMYVTSLYRDKYGGARQHK